GSVQPVDNRALGHTGTLGELAVAVDALMKMTGEQRSKSRGRSVGWVVRHIKWHKTIPDSLRPCFYNIDCSTPIAGCLLCRAFAPLPVCGTCHAHTSA